MSEKNTGKLVLCGPMLRRVTSRSVAVFVALREKKYIELCLHQGPEPDSAILHSHSTTSQELAEGIALGKQLFVALVQLELPETAMLSAGYLYGYNLRFRDTNSTDADFKDLTDDGIKLVGVSDDHIGCAQGKLPAFSLPPPDFNQFNIIHGSCRKPHGGGEDMLAKLDDLIRSQSYRSAEGVADQGKTQYEDPLHRPHLLLLTGDQIYADDVAPPLLRALHDTAGELLGWREEFAGTGLPGGLAEKARVFQQEADRINGNLTGILTSITNDNLQEVSEEIESLLTDLAAAINLVLEDFPDPPPLLQAEYQTVINFLEELLQMPVEWQQIDQHDLPEVLNFINTKFEDLDHLKHYLDFFQNLASDRHWGQIQVDEAAAGSHGNGSNEAGTDVEHDNGTDLANEALSDEQRRIDAYKSLPKQPLILSRISPPQRAKEIREFAAMTSNAMDAHLMFLGDFYMMYLFSWSPEPWPKDDHGSPTLPYYWKSVPNYGLFGDLSKFNLIETRKKLLAFSRGLSKVRRVLANLPTLMIFDDHEVTDDWNLHEEWLINVNITDNPAKNVFGPQLLRNALAAYAIFQDWGNQPQDYKTGQPGATILEQLHCEVVSEDAVSPPGIVSGPDHHSSEALFDCFRLGRHAYNEQTLKTHTDEQVTNLLEHQTIKKWHWQYDPYAGTNDSFFQLRALDTRTWRQFPGTAWQLQYQHHLKETFDLQKDSYIGRKGPANLIHPLALMEQLSGMREEQLNLVISPAPVFGLPLLEDGFQRVLALSGSVEEADYEAWQGNHEGFQNFMDSLSGKKVVLLSGDVHYAYTNYIEFPGETGVNLPFSLAQLCSSSMKNETAMTEALGFAGRSGHLLEFIGKLPTASAVEWNRVLYHLKSGLYGLETKMKDLGNLGNWWGETAPILPLSDQAYLAYVLKLKDNALFNFEMLLPWGAAEMGGGILDFLGQAVASDKLEGTYDRNNGTTEYRVHFLKDEQDLRPFGAHAGPEDQGRTALAQTRRNELRRINQITEVQLLAPELYGYWDEMREVVGFNNIARIQFHAPSSDPHEFTGLDHYLYWQLHKDGVTRDELSYTLHEIPIPHLWLRMKRALVEEALIEYRFWNPSNTTRIRESGHPEAIKRLHTYYALAGLSESFPEEAVEEEIVWGAVFISYLLAKVQAGVLFQSSARTIDFMRFAKKNRTEVVSANPFWLYALNEIKPEVGDLLCNWRELPFSYDDIDPDADTFQAAQCEVIIAISTDGQLTTVGGNLSDSVRQHQIQLNAQGFVPNGSSPTPGSPGAYNALLRIRTSPEEQ